jgi:hypothetical protein
LKLAKEAEGGSSFGPLTVVKSPRKKHAHGRGKQEKNEDKVSVSNGITFTAQAKSPLRAYQKRWHVSDPLFLPQIVMLICFDSIKALHTRGTTIFRDA